MGVPSAASKQLECEYSCAPGAVRRGNFAGAAPGVPMGDGCTRTYAVTAPHLEHFLTVVAGFMAIMNPLANTPIFLGLTEDATPEGRRKIARQATNRPAIICYTEGFHGRTLMAMSLTSRRSFASRAF